MKDENKDTDSSNEKIDYDPTKIDIDKEQILNAPKNFFSFIKSTLSFQDEVNKEETSNTIIANIAFSGANVWVLICSIVIACIGLNSNSTAVIIGAMLISPLMGPIRGVGLAMATQDFKTLMLSLKNFGVMVAISFLVAWLFFLLTPIKAVTPELEARVHPQAMDVLIGFFGGLAGVIAAATGDRSTVVPGVAIATALMPPMCTAAYGVAIGNYSYFIGAFYLFTLNSIFIGLSTVLVIRYLGFPVKEFVSEKVARRVKLYSFVFLIGIVVPSVFMFLSLVRESKFKESVTQFYNNEIKVLDNRYPTKLDYAYNGKAGNIIYVENTGRTHIDNYQLEAWKTQLVHYELEGADLKIKKNPKQDTTVVNAGISEELFENQLKTTQDYKNRLKVVSSELNRYSRRNVNAKFLDNLIKVNYGNYIESIECGSTVISNLQGGLDTASRFIIFWDDSISNPEYLQLKGEIEQHITLNFSNQNPKFLHERKDGKK